MAKPKRVGPLGWNVPIVDAEGRPTPEFMQKWTLQSQVNRDIPQLTTPEQVSALLDILAGTPLSLLVRGSALWQGLVLPDDPALFLNGEGAFAVPPFPPLVDDTQNGLAPILPADATKYLDGTGNWSVPAGGGGGGSIVAPSIIHDYSSRTAGGLANQTIAVTTPTAGHYFIAIMVGFNSTFGFPAGFVTLYSSVIVANQRIALAYKECDGTETSLTFTRSADRIGVSLLEVDKFDAYQLITDGNIGTGLPFSVNAFSPAWGPDAVTAFAGEFDSSGIWSMTSTTGLVVNHPLPVAPDGGNHTGIVAYYDKTRSKLLTGNIASPGSSVAKQVAVFAFGKAP